jgi:hypothetical protein
MHVELDKWCIADAAEAVNLAGFDDQDVAGAGLELLAVYGPEAAAFPHELDFIVRMTMRSGAAARKSAREENGDVHAAMICTDEAMRTALER